MMQTFSEFIVTNTLTAHLTRLLMIMVVTWLAALLGGWLAVRILKARSLTWHGLDERRLLTLRTLVRSAVRVAIYIVGFVVSLFSLGVPAGSIFTALGLFSAAFGLGARPLISDYLAGIIFIFEDQFSVGDKVEMLDITGEVEAVNLRITQLRSTSGELYILPNGDIRVVRNLSRGLFSMATIRVSVRTQNLAQTMHVLEQMADTAQEKLPDLIERPEFFSEEGDISTHVQLTLSAKAEYGKGARLRTRLMTLATEALTEAGVQIID